MHLRYLRMPINSGGSLSVAYWITCMTDMFAPRVVFACHIIYWGVELSQLNYVNPIIFIDKHRGLERMLTNKFSDSRGYESVKY